MKKKLFTNKDKPFKKNIKKKLNLNLQEVSIAITSATITLDAFNSVVIINYIEFSFYQNDLFFFFFAKIK